MSYYTPDVFGHTDAPRGYGVAPDYSGQVDRFSFLEEYLKKGLNTPNKLGDPREQEFFEYMINQQNPTPGFRVDPNKLNLDEFRKPGPAYPGEFLDRDRFLLTSPQSPLAQAVPRPAQGAYQKPRWQEILESTGEVVDEIPNRFNRSYREGFFNLFNRDRQGTPLPGGNPYYGPSPLGGSDVI